MVGQFPDSAQTTGDNHNQAGMMAAILETHPKIDRRVRRVLEIIHTDITRHHLVKDLAKEVNLSPDYLERKFHAVTRQGITRYMQGLKLQKACNLLISSFKSINEIAEEAGFHSLNYFDEVFHNHYGLTPSKYRQQFNNGAGQEK